MNLIHAPVNQLGLELSVDQFRDSFSPYLERLISKDDPEWCSLENYFADKALHLVPSKRHQANVLNEWDGHWSDSSRLDDKFLIPRKNKPGPPWEWRDRGIIMTEAGGPRARISGIQSTLSFLNPSNVLEVGCGDGLNLFALACALPDIEFAGLELTPAGVATALRFQQMSKLSDGMKAFAIDVRDFSGCSRVNFHEGSAQSIPFADDSFDLVYTCVALEQMESIRTEVLNEVRRVAREWVVFLEPFRDVNSEGLRLQHVSAQDYFSMYLQQLTETGFDLYYATGDFPQKLNLGTLLVVARIHCS